MLELPEALTIARQLRETITGKTVCRVLPPTKPHKFCWFSGDPAEYGAKLNGSQVVSSEGFGMFVEIAFDNDMCLDIDDGVNARFINSSDAPKDYQLMTEFSDVTALVFTVAMYGGITLHDGGSDNEYYQKSRKSVSPFSAEFEDFYQRLLSESKFTLSVKAFLATEQRFPGIGNGVLQDILFTAHINPKRKLGTLTAQEKDNLLSCIVSVLREMTDRGGRDTEKDIFGNPGGYITKMSKNTLTSGCPACGGKIVKEAYLGGSVYYCPECQPMI